MKNEFEKNGLAALENLGNKAIEIMGAALAEKQKEVDYWREKAQRLAIMHKACLTCWMHIMDDTYKLESFECLNCYQARTKKEVPHE